MPQLNIKDRFQYPVILCMIDRNACFRLLLLFVLVALPNQSIARDEGNNANLSFRDCSDCPEMLILPAGSFLMGTSVDEGLRDGMNVVPPRETSFARQDIRNEQPQHLVSIGHPFAIGKYPVTQRQFANFVRETGYSTGGGCTFWVNHTYPDHPDADWSSPGFEQADSDPVVCVSWNDAMSYVKWLNGKVDRGPYDPSRGPYRLPTEAEWEYAARSGTRTARWWGDDIGSGNADCDGCGSRWDKAQPAPVDSFKPNPFGLFDMLGNVWE
jgi:formylglycine-generating enzyme required for sulfatase activity